MNFANRPKHLKMDFAEYTSKCGKDFTCAENYETHTIVHTGENPYKCETVERALNVYQYCSAKHLFIQEKKPFVSLDVAS